MIEQKEQLLQQQIDDLPSGGVTYKTINGKRYAYYQWREDGKQHSKRISDEEYDALKIQIEQRKALQKQLKNPTAISSVRSVQPIETFHMGVRIGEDLQAFVRSAAQWKKRECFPQLTHFLFEDNSDKVFVLYGLRRTGKTTLIKQAIAEMTALQRQKAVFIQATAQLSLADINRDLQQLERLGYRYVFIDEVTLLNDFIEGAALLSDIFAACGMKIVLSGTDSLGFVFTKSEQLYDRCFMLHTTFISYREFETVLGIHGIDEYIRYGGTMSLSGANYNAANSPFFSKETADQYVNTAIAHNIQHSLKNYQYGGHFRHLQELYEKGELTSVINRVVEDINHRFTIEVLTKDFQSNDLGISANNLRHDRSAPNDILDRIDQSAFTKHLRKLLDILNRQERSIEIEEEHRTEIQEYLELLDLTVKIDEMSLPANGPTRQRTVFSQPGIRYAQAEAFVQSLKQDAVFSGLSLAEKNLVTERILNEIKGRMMEDIILLETKIAYPNYSVFKLQFAVGEFDMVVCDPVSATCEIFEIKYSSKVVPAQVRHLIDENKGRQTEFQFGRIVGKYVLYRGETMEVNGIHYQNVEEYLNRLPV